MQCLLDRLTGHSHNEQNLSFFSSISNKCLSIIYLTSLQYLYSWTDGSVGSDFDTRYPVTIKVNRRILNIVLKIIRFFSSYCGSIIIINMQAL